MSRNKFRSGTSGVTPHPSLPYKFPKLMEEANLWQDICRTLSKVTHYAWMTGRRRDTVGGGVMQFRDGVCKRNPCKWQTVVRGTTTGRRWNLPDVAHHGHVDQLFPTVLIPCLVDPAPPPYRSRRLFFAGGVTAIVYSDVSPDVISRRTYFCNRPVQFIWDYYNNGSLRGAVFLVAITVLCGESRVHCAIC